MFLDQFFWLERPKTRIKHLVALNALTREMVMIEILLKSSDLKKFSFRMHRNSEFQILHTERAFSERALGRRTSFFVTKFSRLLSH